MSCLKCGKDVDSLLCDECLNVENLNSIFYAIMKYDYANCDNQYINSFVDTFHTIREAQENIPKILELFDSDITESYYCKYYKY